MTGLWLVAVPWVTALVGLALGGLGRRWAGSVAVLGSSATLVVAVGLAAQHPWVSPITSTGRSGPWAVLPMATVVDGLAVSVAVMVAIVALLVQIYSTAYMRDEPRYSTYAAFISLFTAAMLAVVVAGDLLLLVIGWEVMGLCSYVLIGQNWQEPAARAAAVKAFLVTKTGDVGFIVGIIVLISTTGSLLLPDAVTVASHNTVTATVVTLLLLMGVVGKSAQFPLHAWLPDAMAGPSPVSALIHAATMVAAGIYVVARTYPMWEAAPVTLGVMAVLACVTMLGGALAALAQADLKRVLAWSTVSQLAYMLAALAVGGEAAAVFHLVSHAFFKALLFLAAGAVIHSVGSTQMAQMGGLRRSMPVTSATMAVALLSLVGVPVLDGFFSKESVIEAAHQAAVGDAVVGAWAGWMVLVTAAVTVAVTAAYAARLWLRTFAGDYRGSGTPHEAPGPMRWPLVVLAVPTMLFGFTGLAAQWFPTWSLPSATMTVVPQALRPAPTTTAVSLALAAVGVWAVYRRWRTARASDPVELESPAASLAGSGFGWDAVYEVLAVRPFGHLSSLTSRFDDRVIGRAVNGVGVVANDLGTGVQRVHQGRLQRALTATLTLTVLGLVLVAVAVST
ncbi:MAG: NADH-quinone oxidoreductase subunit L [Actinomycetes bacterium]